MIDFDSSMMEQRCYERTTPVGSLNGPYLLHAVHRVAIARQWNPSYDQDAECVCGHSYHRHFDSYENMLPIGCKYCGCGAFTLEGMEHNQLITTSTPRLHQLEQYVMGVAYVNDKHGYYVGIELPHDVVDQYSVYMLSFHPKHSEKTYQQALNELVLLSKVTKKDLSALSS